MTGQPLNLLNIIWNIAATMFLHIYACLLASYSTDKYMSVLIYVSMSFIFSHSNGNEALPLLQTDRQFARLMKMTQASVLAGFLTKREWTSICSSRVSYEEGMDQELMKITQASGEFLTKREWTKN